MKQVVQSLVTGRILVEEVPSPTVSPGTLRVANRCSAVSVGTERSTIERVRRGPLQEAAAHPELLRQLLRTLAGEGLGPAMEKVQARLERPLTFGYSCAGVVQETGGGVDRFRVGDPVACAGYGYASHAEEVLVPEMLCAKIPQGVSWEEAAFTTLGAIAMQAVRVANLQVGESVCLFGLGIIGQLIAQAAGAGGCHVFGIDPHPERVALAQELGMEGGAGWQKEKEEEEDLIRKARSFTQDRGFDAIILAAATEDSRVLSVSGELAREKGKIVVVGEVPLEIPRERFYEKELELRWARSYGPGRYDPAYEERGADYPFAYVRWTAQRNMESFLRLVASGRIRVSPLVTHRFPIDEAPAVYEGITDASGRGPLGLLFEYGKGLKPEPNPPPLSPASAPGVINFGVVGAGRFATGVLIPSLLRIPGVAIRKAASAHGITAAAAARRFRIPEATTDPAAVISDPALCALLIATPHHLHADMVLQGLRRGKHLFVEKPLCLTEKELQEIAACYRSLERPPLLAVGFNRRFSWAAGTAKELLRRGQGPWTILYRVNAGSLPAEGWWADSTASGGRILGEMGHFIDLVRFFVGAPVLRVSAAAHPPQGQEAQPSVTARLVCAEGSVATIVFTTQGDPAYPKEWVEIVGGKMVLQIDNFRSVTSFHQGRKNRAWRFFQDKGFSGELAAFCRALASGGPAPCPFEELFNTTLATIRIVESIRSDRSLAVEPLPDGPR